MSRANDRVARSRAIFERAARLMAEYQIPPLPAHYEIWYGYASEESPHLTRALDAWIESREPFSESFVEDIRARFFDAPPVLSNLNAVGDRLGDELDKLTHALETVGQDTSTYNTALSGAAGALVKTIDVASIKTIVENLVAATRHMERRSRDLEGKLQTSTNEVRSLREDIDAIRRQSLTDQLTGIANRKCFDDRLREALQEASKGGSLCLLMGDIDHFKRFNDTWGHQTGDQVLRLVGRCLTENVKGRDTPARYGGEEFAVILPNTAMADAARLADQIRTAVEAKKVVKRSTGETLGTITMSIGIASYDPGDTAASLIERADAGLYEAKDAGRNCVKQMTVARMARPSAA